MVSGNDRRASRPRREVQGDAGGRRHASSGRCFPARWSRTRRRSRKSWLGVINGRWRSNLKRNPGIDVVVLDIDMPVMDGLTALPQIKLAAKPEVKIIMNSTLTRKNADIQPEGPLRAGAADYTAKPTSSRPDALRRGLFPRAQAARSRPWPPRGASPSPRAPAR